MKSLIAAFAVVLGTAVATPLAAQQADLKKPLVKDGKTYTYQEGMPYVERGQMKNPVPVQKREPTPVEKVVTKVMEGPVSPAIVNGQPGISYTKKTP